MKNNYLFLLLALLFSCTSPSPEEQFSRERRKVTHQALGCFKKAMRAKGFKACGIGEAVDHSTGKQKNLGVIFDIEELPNVEFARRLIVKTIDEFLLCINSTEGIQDYLVKYPFTVQDIETAFLSGKAESGLFSVSNFRNELIYRKNDPNNLIGPTIEVHRESYEEAVRILAEQKTCTGNVKNQVPQEQT